VRSNRQGLSRAYENAARTYIVPVALNKAFQIFTAELYPQLKPCPLAIS
jgi:hypothetical protein